MAHVCVCACVRACAVEIKPGMLRAVCSMMYAFARAYSLPYKIAPFHNKKGLLNTVYKRKPDAIVSTSLWYLCL